MNFFTHWMKGSEKQDDGLDTDGLLPEVDERHSSLLFQYREKYINALNPRHRYDVREQLKSGQIITHCTDVTLQEAKDYVRMVWINSSPPNFLVEVTTTR